MNNPSSPQRPVVPDHELLRPVGRGGYGEVWLARNIMGTFRAVKIVYRDRFDSDRPYEREFGGLQKFEPASRGHPGLVNVLHIGRNSDAGYFYCIMEMADDISAGQNINQETYRPRTLASELAKHGRWPVGDCIRLGISLADALGYLHSRGLVHRDIKPSNIIFIAGQPKFADIGLVTQIGAKATYVGTEGYLAPEGPGAPTADLYSLGRALYEISMGKSQDQFPELPTRLRELPEAADLMALNAVVLRACEHQPSKRFQSAEELKMGLSGLGGAGQVSAVGSSRQIQQAETEGKATFPAISRDGGPRVVILFQSEAPVDAALAKELAEQLAAEGYAVFTDEQRELSIQWARRIEQEIRSAQAVIPFLSGSSIQSEAMAYCIEIALQASRRPGGLPRVVPVFVGKQEPLTRHLEAALQGAAPIQAAAGEPLPKLISEALKRSFSPPAKPASV